ncbi:MAG: glycosyltransferase, partial [Candidatus Andersenbacteria bacterium]
HHSNISTGNIIPYFIQHTERFYVFIYPRLRDNQPAQFYEYNNSVKTRSLSLWIYKGKKKWLLFLLSYFYFYYWLIVFSIRNTKVIVSLPIFLAGSSVLNILTRNTYVFWVFDHNPATSNLERAYNTFLSWHARHTKHTIYLSPALARIYHGTENQVASFGIKPVARILNPVTGHIGYIGDLREFQGLDLLCDIVLKNKELHLDIIGNGVYYEKIAKYIKKHQLQDRITLFGYTNYALLPEITKNWEAGLALYETGGASFAQYTEPGKIKLYAELGIPVIMTDVSYIADIVKKYKTGELVAYSEKAVLPALETIRTNYKSYTTGIARMRADFEYTNHYKKTFTFLE